MAILVLQLIANALLVLGAAILALFSVSEATIEMIYRGSWVRGHKVAYFFILIIIYVFGRGFLQALFLGYDFWEWIFPLAAIIDAAGVPQAPNWLAITIEVGAFSLLIALAILEILFINVFDLPEKRCDIRNQRMARWNVCALIAVFIGFSVQMALFTMNAISISQCANSPIDSLGPVHNGGVTIWT